MNVLSKVKSDKRVVEVKQALENGEAPDRAGARIASGAVEKRPPVIKSKS